MKKTIFTLAITVFIAGTFFTACVSPSQKLENAEDKVIDAKKAVIDARSELNQAYQDSITEYQQFKIEAENRILANEKSIDELRLKIKSAKNENSVLYHSKLAELQKRNYELKIKLAEYNADETNKWKEFKTEFKNDMDDLGKAFSDFTVKDDK